MADPTNTPAPNGDGGDPAAPAGGSGSSEPTTTAPGEPTTAADLDALIAAADKWRGMARKHEKAAASAQAQLDALQRQSMSDQERAVADAIAAAKADAAKELAKTFGGRLVAAEVKAAAAGRLSAESLNRLVNALDVSRFLGDDGEVLVDEISTLVSAVIVDSTPPPPPSPLPVSDIGQGAGRSKGTVPLGSDALGDALRRAVGLPT